MIAYLRREKVLLIAAILAVISAFFVPPDLGYINYIDTRVLVLLYCLMVIVKGFQEAGLFDVFVKTLTSKLKDARALARMMIFSCFFFSMLMTNDVALITFVPFAIYTLQYCRLEKFYIIVIVLQTIAANLGSMATPIGNPQNLFLFSVSNMSTLDFEKTVMIYVAVAFVLLFLLTFLIPKEKIEEVGDLTKSTMSLEKKSFIVYVILFIAVILTVLRLIPLAPVFVAMMIVLLVIKKGWLLKQVDFALLLTFVCLFVFVGNIGQIEMISSRIEGIIAGREILCAAIGSQFLSNVPVAMLLAGFTDKIPELIVGTNIGGLGTIIASMASVISFKAYTGTKGAKTGKYLAVFSVYNFAGLAIMLGLAYLLNHMGTL